MWANVWRKGRVVEKSPLWAGMLAELKTEDPRKAAVVQHNQFDPLGNLKSRSEQLGWRKRVM